jgi:hypothetical protein
MTTIATRSLYAGTIRADLARLGFVGLYDPRHIEAYMRIGHGTLDHLDARAFRAEVQIAIDCIRFGGVEQAEECAKSFGL